MIILEKIAKKLGTRVLFDDVSVSFNAGNRYGLTGPNGAGKSTLLKIIIGDEEPSSGQVILPKKVGFLRQDIENFQEITTIDSVIMGNTRLWEALIEKDQLYEQEMSDAIGMRLAEIEDIIAEEDGYSAESYAENLLLGMGIDTYLHLKPLKQLPTDLQFRSLLCQALFGEPQALLLDEPTNHLDLESIGWLERFLYAYQGTLIVVSHDRHFLNTVTTHIADIDYDTIIIYSGNYDQMLVTKTSVRERAEQENKSKEKKVRQLKEFVARFGAGTRASQVQSRVREINRLQPQELKKSNIQRPYIRFPSPAKPSGKSVLKLKNIKKAYEKHTVLNAFSYEVMRGDKIAIIGNNGLGKTTLLKIMTGLVKPDQGQIEIGHQVSLGYFPQTHAECIDKKDNMTSFDWLKQSNQTVYDQDIRSALGKMLFSGDDAFKPLSALSGGETARLILAALMLQAHNTLLLDEPTNHLDLESVSALSTAINAFEGTALIVSHNRDLINEVATKLIAFEKDGIHFFEGPLEEYLKARV